MTIGTPMSKKRAKSISDVLRRAIADSGLTYSELERATGVKRSSIMRFVRGERSLRLDNADALARQFGIYSVQSPAKTHRRAALATEKDITRIPVLSYLLRLMMAIDAMKSAFRSWNRMYADESDVAKTDQLMCTVTMMGWAGEAIRLLQEGVKQNYLNREMLGAVHQALWDKIFAKPAPNEIKRIQRARDKYFAHWDESIAKTALKRIAQDGNALPFLEFGADGSFQSTRCPWVSEAIAGDMVGGNPDVAAIRKAIQETSEVTTGMAKLVSHLAVTVSDANDLGIHDLPES